MPSEGGRNIVHPYGIIHFRDTSNKLWFYWTEFTSGHIMRMKNEGAKNETRIVRTIKRVLLAEAQHRRLHSAFGWG